MNATTCFKSRSYYAGSVKYPLSSLDVVIEFNSASKIRLLVSASVEILLIDQTFPEASVIVSSAKTTREPYTWILPRSGVAIRSLNLISPTFAP